MSHKWKQSNSLQKLELVIKHWNINSSAASIANSISKDIKDLVSKNAIIGIYNRNPELRQKFALGDPKRRNIPAKNTQPKILHTKMNEDPHRLAGNQATSFPSSSKKALAETGQERFIHPSGQFYCLVDNRGCSWPMAYSQSQGHLFCGLVRLQGRPYCEAHQKASKAAPQVA
jgi:hypothetical protein